MKFCLYVVIFSFVIGILTSCGPVNKPQFEEVGTNETAFVIELEGQDQVKLNSADAYDQKKVTQRRIIIPKRKNHVGRGWQWWAYEWIPTVRVIVVDRSPVTREWTADTIDGTSVKDEAIWVESQDSIGFSVGFNCTAFIQEKDASTFLYYYPSNSLANVMDTEIRNRIQSVASEESAKEDLDTLREKKNQIILAIRQDVVPFFEKRGITITTIGMFGGFAYENKNIQNAIDEVFIAEQVKNQESALLSAMESKEQRLKREGTAIANQKREEARGDADAIKLVAEAEAESIRLINNIAKEAANNPLLYQLKILEVEQARIAKWDGSVPKLMMGNDGGNFIPMIQIPNE